MYFTLKDFNLANKRVLVRVDFNVPLDKHGRISDDTRIAESLPTIRYILKQKPKQLILMSHLGRPEGKVVESFSLKPVAKKLGELLKQKVHMSNDCVLPLPKERIMLLENLRFHKEEEKNDEGFARILASHADYYVNDAFGTSHRGHASNDAITRFLPGCTGFLMEKEIANLSKALEPERPYVTIMGGAKGDKLQVFEEFAKKADKMLFGGVLANTLLLAAGKNIGASIYDDSTRDFAAKVIREEGYKIVMPVDVAVGERFSADAKAKIVDVDEVPAHGLIMDIGPKTIALYEKELAKAKTVTWNGPIGVFEFKDFANGTKEIGKFLAKSRITTIIGGGDSAAAIVKFGLKDRMTHVSTGGGASLEFLTGKKLPAIKALEENYIRFKDKR